MATVANHLNRFLGWGVLRVMRMGRPASASYAGARLEHGRSPYE